MIVLDASVLAHFGKGNAHAAAALNILENEEALSIDPLNLAEVLVRPAQQGRADVIARTVERLGIEVLSMEPDQALALAELRARTGLRLPDCCVLVAAIQHAASVATFDERLRTAALEMGVTVVGGGSEELG